MPAGRIYYFDNHDRFSLEAAQMIAGLIVKAVDSRGICHMVLAGGKTPGRTYEYLGETTRLRGGKTGPEWSALNLFLSDERILPPGDTDTNTMMVHRHLVDQIPHFNSTLNTPDLSIEAPSRIADQYEQLIRSCFPPGNRWPAFDIVLLGIGHDGHTASLFPDGPTENPEKRWVLDTFSSNAKHPRVTLSIEAINSARNILFLAGGRSKRMMIRRVLDGDPTLPASHIRPRNGHLYFLIYE